MFQELFFQIPSTTIKYMKGKTKYKYFDLKFDRAKDFKKQRSYFGVKFYITKNSNNNSPPFALILS